jgi:hypothetical protein
MWFKRGGLGAGQALWNNGGSGYSGGQGQLFLGATDAMHVYDGSSVVITTNRLFRDVGAWYHVVLEYDTGESGTDKCKLWINGVLETSFATDNRSTAPALNGVNESGIETNIGSAYAGASFFNGSISHVHLIDGTAYDASTFGETDATSGIWKIKTSPSVTYGTNGYFLKMEDRTNLDLDSGTNTFTFTTSGTLTATYDNPSNNFATMNSLDNYYQEATFSNGNNTITKKSGAYYTPNTATLGMASGKWYFEVKPTTAAANENQIGISSTQSTAANQELGHFPNDWCYYSYNGNYRNNNTNTAYGDAYTVDDIIGVAVDLTNSKLYFSKNGTWQDSGDPTSGATGTGAISITAVGSTPLGSYFPAFNYQSSDAGVTNANFGNGYFGTTAITSAGVNAGSGLFEYDVPSGYLALNTKNIATDG